MIARLLAFRRRRRLLRSAREVAREARWISRRRAHRLTAAQRERLEAARTSLDGALASRDPGQLTSATDGARALLDGELRGARKSALRSFAESIGPVVFAALFLRAFVVEAYQIPSGSMIPTLQVGDRIFVNKFVHGFRVPFTRSKIATDLTPIRRGEVIVFLHPDATKDEDLIKRVVAVAGDSVELRDDVVYVNGAPAGHAAESGDCTYHDYDDQADQWSVRACLAYRDTLDGRSFTTLHDPGAHMTAFGPVKVPPGHVFVLGDNRDHSSDSRFWGFVPDQLIEGRAMFVWWSWGDEGLRAKRLLHYIE